LIASARGSRQQPLEAHLGVQVDARSESGPRGRFAHGARQPRAAEVLQALEQLLLQRGVEKLEDLQRSILGEQAERHRALLALQPEGGTNWVLGVVRRVNKSAGQQARVGIETGATFDRNSALPMTLYTMPLSRE